MVDVQQSIAQGSLQNFSGELSLVTSWRFQAWGVSKPPQEEPGTSRPVYVDRAVAAKGKALK